MSSTPDKTKIGVPLTMFRKDDKGLLLSITGKQFSDAVAKAHARAKPSKPSNNRAQHDEHLPSGEISRASCGSRFMSVSTSH